MSKENELSKKRKIRTIVQAIEDVARFDVSSCFALDNTENSREETEQLLMEYRAVTGAKQGAFGFNGIPNIIWREMTRKQMRKTRIKKLRKFLMHVIFLSD